MKLSKLVLALGLIATPALAADDTGLYPPPPPAGTVYVRYFGTEPLKLGEAVLGDRAYHPLMQGHYKANTQDFSFDAGKHYSIVTGGDGQLVLLTDPELENRARALIVMYNFTDQPALDLITIDGKTKVISGVMLKESGSQMVQPISADLVVSINGQKSIELGAITLQRNTSYSIFAVGSGSGITANIVQDTTVN